MKSYNYKIINNNLEDSINFEEFKNQKNILIQIFCGKEKKEFEKTIEILTKKIPQAICIGATSDGEIYENEVNTNSIVINISVFEKTILKSAFSSNTDSFERGKELAQNLITDNTKLLILFSNTLKTNAEEFLNGVQAINRNIIIAGGMAADNGSFNKTFVSFGSEVLDNSAVGVSLNSDILHVINDFRFNWSSIGVEHEITKAKDNAIYEINGLKTLDFYTKYLGEEILEDLPQGAVTFPILIKRNSNFLARTLIAINEDGSFLYSGNFKNGDKIKFGFGNAETILKTPIIPKDKDYSNIETFFIYSCMARRRYVPDVIHIENEAYSNIATTSGFFTFGEFFHKKRNHQLLNQSFTVVGLSEDIEKNEKKELINTINNKSTNSYSKTIKTLTHLIEQSSKDYDEQSYNLEVEKINSQMLLTSQKIFLRHAVHETNTPLSVIMSNIELFEMQYGKNPYLSTIEVALKNIFNIYDDLSYLVKKDQVLYPKRKIDLVDYIRSRIEFFEQSAQQIGSQIKFFSEHENLIFEFNETKLQRIIDNNLTNAIKYTEENSNIYITLKQEYEDSHALVMSSCSQYIQYPEKIFKEYYREESTKKGFGLGLSLVKRICDEENIKISIDSNEYFTSFRYLFKVGNN